MTAEQLPPDGYSLGKGWRVEKGADRRRYYINDRGDSCTSTPIHAAEAMGAIVRKAEVPTCANWCGVNRPNVFARARPCNDSSDGRECFRPAFGKHRDTCFCSRDCRDAGRPLHPAAEQPSGNTGELPACLRSMTPEEQAAFVPLTDAQISDALAKGVRDRELAERPWMRRPDESSEAPATPIRCSCDESIALRAALKRVLEICTTDGGQWVDIAEVAQAALGEEQSDGK